MTLVLQRTKSFITCSNCNSKNPKRILNCKICNISLYTSPERNLNIYINKIHRRNIISKNINYIKYVALIYKYKHLKLVSTKISNLIKHINYNFNIKLSNLEKDIIILFIINK